MAVSKYKRSLKKKLNSELGMIVSDLRKENASLKKTLIELAHYHAEHNKLLESLLSLEATKLENCQQLAGKDEKMLLPPEELCTNEGNVANDVSMRGERRTPTYEEDIEEINNKIAAISAKCQYLESRVTGNQDSTSDEPTPPSDGGISVLQNQLSDALEKVKKWQQYDQEGEAFVRSVVSLILELQGQLNEAHQTCSHHEDHSAENSPSQVPEHYVNVLMNLREQLDVTHQKLVITQGWCREKDKEIEELKQHLYSKMISKQNAKEEDHHYAEAEDPPTNDESTELQHTLQEEKRKSASFELQAKLFQGYMLNHYHADQEKIENLERQLKISSQDLEDERRNCSYLKWHISRILKVMRKTKGHAKKQSKRHQCVVEEEQPASPASSRESLASSSQSSPLNESILECPSCQSQYPAGRYQELLLHLEGCFE